MNLKRLDPRHPLPLHAQAEQALRALIRAPAYRAGALLPDELTLANRLGVSRGTLRAAVGRLVQEGRLVRRAGVGTRVVPPRPESGIAAWRSFSREMARKGVRVEDFQRRFARAPLPPPAAAALGLGAGAAAWRLDRIRGWDGRPVLRSRSWFHPRLGLTGREVFDGPLYEVLERATGASPHTAREEFSAVAADAALAARLAVPRGEPLLLRRHTVFDAGGRPMEFAEVHYVSARFALTLDLRRDEETEPERPGETGP